MSETKVLIEDDTDVPNIVKHVSIMIIHHHSGNLKLHTHHK